MLCLLRYTIPAKMQPKKIFFCYESGAEVKQADCEKNSGTIPGPEFRILSAAAIDSAAAFAGLNRLRNVPSADVGISFRLPHIESGIQLNESREGEIIDTKKQWPGREKLAIALESLKNEYRISE